MTGPELTEAYGLMETYTRLDAAVAHIERRAPYATHRDGCGRPSRVYLGETTIHIGVGPELGPGSTPITTPIPVADLLTFLRERRRGAISARLIALGVTDWHRRS